MYQLGVFDCLYDCFFFYEFGYYYLSCGLRFEIDYVDFCFDLIEIVYFYIYYFDYLYCSYYSDLLVYG